MTNETTVAHRKLINKAIADGRLRIGLPMWYRPEWAGRWLPRTGGSADALRDYAAVFGSIEGNTSFYALPGPERVSQWLSLVPPGFRFTFKVPRMISHAGQPLQALRQHGPELRVFLHSMISHAGVLMLQLPGDFTSRRCGELLALLDQLQDIAGWPVAVECRHASFFDKGAGEQQLLRGLADRRMDRVVFDSRGLFKDTSGNPDVLEAQRKKPAMPVHPVATGRYPVVRFIGFSDWQYNQALVLQWQQKIVQWLQEGREPYVFLHTPGNHDVPGFARWVVSQWGAELPLWPAEQQRGEDLFGVLL